jgi:hypothetical protein
MELPFPSLLKRSYLKRFAVDHQLEILAETGTFLGDTPWAFRSSFKEIYPIELSETLAKLARNRFASVPDALESTGRRSQAIPKNGYKDVAPLENLAIDNPLSMIPLVWKGVGFPSDRLKDLPLCCRTHRRTSYPCEIGVLP